MKEQTREEPKIIAAAERQMQAWVRTAEIEGRAIRRQELLGALQRSMRQRSFDRMPRREYVLHFLKQHPP